MNEKGRIFKKGTFFDSEIDYEDEKYFGIDSIQDLFNLAKSESKQRYVKESGPIIKNDEDIYDTDYENFKIIKEIKE